MRGARAVTVVNATDASDAGVPRNRSRLDCFALMKRHGLSTENAEPRGAMLRACDNIWFLRAALGKARTSVNRDRFVALAERLGTSFRSPLAYRTEISPIRHAGIAGYRRMGLDDGCGCFLYTSGVYEP